LPPEKLNLDELKDNLVDKGLPQIPIKDNEVDVLCSPENFRNMLIEKIRNAKNRIYISALYIEDDVAGKEILESIRERKKEKSNLEINIIVDFHRNQRGRIGEPERNPRRLFNEINNELSDGNKINFIGIPIAQKERNGVLHTKGIVIDDCVLYSGASINNVYLQKQSNENPNNNYRLDRYWIFKNKNLANSFIEYFNEAFINNEARRNLDSDENVIKDKELKNQIEKARKKLRKLQFTTQDCIESEEEDMYAVPISGFGKRSILNKTIVDLINAAEKNITIFTPYFNISKEIRNAISNALKRNVEITINIGDKTTNDFYRSPEKIEEDKKKELSKRDRRTLSVFDKLPYLYEQNLKKFALQFKYQIESTLLNINIWKDGDGNTYHAKGIDIDDGKAILITGHNINVRAEEKDIENGILIVNTTKETRNKLSNEKIYITTKTKRLGSCEELESIKDYPSEIQKWFNTVWAGAKIKGLI